MGATGSAARSALYCHGIVFKIAPGTCGLTVSAALRTGRDRLCHVQPQKAQLLQGLLQATCTSTLWTILLEDSAPIEKKHRELFFSTGRMNASARDVGRLPPRSVSERTLRVGPACTAFNERSGGLLRNA